MLVMELRHIGAGKVGDPVTAEAGLDVSFHRPVIFFGGSRLAVLRHVFPQEPVGKFCNRYGNLLPVPNGCRVATACLKPQKAQRLASRPVRCPR